MKNIKQICLVLILFLFLKFVCVNYTNLNTNTNTLGLNSVFWKMVFFLNNSSLNIWFLLLIYFYKKINSKESTFYTTLFILFFNYNDYYNHNYFININDSFINKELYNGLLIIHPILTYVTIIFYLLIFSNQNVFFLKKKKSIDLKKSKSKTLKILFLGFSALFLGSVWAQQELNWGGWWNWDSVEIILLSLNLLILVIIHIDLKKISSFLKTWYFYKSVYVIIFYTVVRSNIITSIHAFSINNHLQKYFYFYFLLLLILIIYFFIKIYNKYILFLKNNSSKTIYKNLKIYNLYNYINLLIVLITLINIIIFFLNEKININVYKYISFFIKISIINYYYFFFKKKINISLFTFFIFFNDIFLIKTLFFYFFFKNNFIFKKKFHFLIIILFFLLIESCDFIIKNNFEMEFFYLSFFKNINIVYFNDFLYNYNFLLNCICLFFKNSMFFLKNNYNYFLENNINVLIQSGFNSNFFNSNLLNYNNLFLINYILDGNVFIKFDFFLKNVTILFLSTPVFFILLKIFFLKNGIV